MEVFLYNRKLTRTRRWNLRGLTKWEYELSFIYALKCIVKFCPTKWHCNRKLLRFKTDIPEDGYRMILRKVGYLLTSSQGAANQKTNIHILPLWEPQIIYIKWSHKFFPERLLVVQILSDWVEKYATENKHSIWKSCHLAIHQLIALFLLIWLRHKHKHTHTCGMARFTRTLVLHVCAIFLQTRWCRIFLCSNVISVHSYQNPKGNDFFYLGH